MNIPQLNIDFTTNIKKIKQQKFHPKMLKVQQSKIYIIPFFKITEELIMEFINNRFSILELFTNKQYLMQFITFLNDKIKMPKKNEEKELNTVNTIQLLIKLIFKKDILFFLATHKYRIFKLDIKNINPIPKNNIYDAKIDLLLVHHSKDSKATNIKMTCKLKKQRIAKLINETFKFNYNVGNLAEIYKNPYYKYVKRNKTQKK